MNRNKIQSEIQYLLGAIKEQNQTIFGYDGSIPSIEIDLMLETIRRLYERYKDLTKVEAVRQSPNTTSYSFGSPAPPRQQHDDLLKAYTKQEIKDRPTQKHEELKVGEDGDKEVPKTVEKTSESIEKSAADEEKDSKEKDINTLIDEELAEALKKVESSMDPEFRERLNKLREQSSKLGFKPGSSKPTKPSSTRQAEKTDLNSLNNKQKSLGETFKSEQKSVYEQINQKNKATIADRIQQNPVRDLHTAIGLNDKFAFINDLFGGSMAEYSRAVDRLNGASGYNEAMVLIKRLEEKNSWDYKSESVKKFQNYINRRFQA